MHQHLSLIYSNLLRYHPDLMIFMDGHNDMSGPMGPGSGVEPYDAYAGTPHDAEFESMVFPKSLQSLILINATWLRNNSVLFDLMYRRVLASGQSKALGPGVDRARPVTSPVAFADLTGDERRRASRVLARAGYYADGGAAELRAHSRGDSRAFLAPAGADSEPEAAHARRSEARRTYPAISSDTSPTCTRTCTGRFSLK